MKPSSCSLFISYRRSDSPDTVKLLYERLKAGLPKTWEVFYDHRAIPPGEAFPQLLRDKVTSADVVLVVIGPNWLKEFKERARKSGFDYVREEVRLALESGHRVIPVTVINARKVRRSDLKEFVDVLPLADLNSPSIRPEPDFDTDVNKLVAYLEQIGPGVGIGTILDGKYKIIRELGAGGMGIVYAAEQQQPRRTVAIKLIKPGMDSREVLARFDAERQALAVMDHPNIARVLDAGLTAGGRPWFAMDYVKGIPITQYCDEHKLTPDTRLGLFSLVCEAIQHAHQKGIIHRDIKPTNVLVEVLEGKPIPKVIDFGLAKALGYKLTDMTLITTLETRVGTLEYSSPEQAAGKTLEIDTRTDIYSLGALLYELLSGEPPFRGDELLKAGEDEMRRVIREVDPLRPSVKLSSSNSLPAVAQARQMDGARLTRLLRGDLDWIVMKALDKDPRRRYETANGFAHDVMRYLAGEPVIAAPPSTGYHVKKFLRKHQRPVVAVLLVLITLIAGMIGTGWFAISASIARKEADARTVEAAKEAQKARAAEMEAEAKKIEAIAAQTTIEAMLPRLANSNVMLATAKWEQQRTTDAVRELYAVPERFRNFEWYLARRMFQGSDVTCYGHRDRVSCVAYSCDGQQIASGGSNSGVVIIFNAITGREIRTLHSLSGRVNAVAYSPRNNVLASGYFNGDIKLWDSDTGAEIRTIKGHQGSVNCLCFSTDGSQIVSGGSDNQVKLWDPNTGVEQATFLGHEASVESVCFRPDGNRIASGSADNHAKIWEIRTGDELNTLHGHMSSVSSVCFSPDGQRLATGSWDHSVRIWDSNDGQTLELLQGPEIMFCVTFSPDGGQVAASCFDGSITIWDSHTGSRLRRLVGHTAARHGDGPVYCLAFNPDGSRIASGGLDRTVKIWDAITGSNQITLFAHTLDCTDIVLSADAKRIVSCGLDGNLKVWDLESGCEELEISSNKSLLCVDIDSGGNQIGAGGTDNTIKIWAASDGQLKATCAGHGDPVTDVAFSPDGSWIASGSGDDSVRLWDTSNGVQIKKLAGHQGTVYCVAVSPDGKLVASGSEDGTINIWDVATEKVTQKMQGHAGWVQSVAFSRDGSKIVSGHERKSVFIWDVATGAKLLAMAGQGGRIHSVAFTPDGSRFATGSNDNTVRVWDSTDGRELMSLVGHNDWVWSVSFSNDGKRLVSGSRDGTIKLWDASRENELIFLEQTGATGHSIAFSENEMYVFDNSRRTTWECQSGRITNVIGWEQKPSYLYDGPSKSGHWFVSQNMNGVFLVDLFLKQSQFEESYRNTKARFNSKWHVKLAEQSEARQEWFAATFHRAWLMKADPNSADNYDSLHLAYENLQQERLERAKGDGSKSTAGSLVEPPIVNEMLSLPRGAKPR